MKALITTIFLLLCFYSSTQTCTTISDGTYGNAQTTPLSPMYGLFDYSWSSNIYYASEIGAAKTISSLSWYVDEYQSGYSQTGPYTFSNIKIYFAYTTLSGWASTTNVSGVNRLTGINAAQGITSWTKVYDGAITFNTVNAWKTITLTTPFSYNGTSNLVVHVENWDGAWAYGYPIFHYTNMNTSTSQRTMKYGAQDVSMGPTSGSRFYARADIQFCVATALPIELMSFTGHNSGSRNILEWVTASENNNAYFTLDRGTYQDEMQWVNIATQMGAGNSTTIHNYNYTDNTFSRGINYYRLTQTDFNGDYKTFPIISIDNRPEARYIIKYINSIGQEVKSEDDAAYIIYSDGTVEKVIKNQ